jgi:eukaryotic-like serine/threonine-protein kinase
MPKAHDDDLVMNLVELAQSQPPETREAYLRAACGGDTELFREVWDYVHWKHHMQDFLLEPLYSALPEHQFKPGELLLDRFRIVREIGQGGMAMVYEAWDERLKKRIALKCAKAGFHKRLPDEVRHASNVSHPNVCKIFEIHTASTPSGEIDFITMEYLEGETLAERLRRGPAPVLPEAEAHAIARQLCDGLAEAHRNGVIHGDLKSSNVILAKSAGGATQAVITDFGLARTSLVPAASAEDRISTVSAAHSQAAGTPDYMAPELWKGEKPSPASDIYALGVILYELASGRRPFGPETPIDQRIAAKPPATLAKWRRVKLDAVLARCLDPDPAQRFSDSAEVARALEPSNVRKWALAAAAAVVLAAAAGVVEWSIVSAPKESVRLAVLPFEADAATVSLGGGLLQDTGDRLSRVKPGRARFTLIPLRDALQNKVNRPEEAGSRLGATHSLSGTLRQENGHIIVRAYLTDTHARVNLADWSADYATSELSSLPVAMAGMVTGTLRLPPLAAASIVNAAAYPAWAEGVSLARGDPKDIDRALDLLEHAAATDPSSPLTHARLAEAQLLKYEQTSEDQWWRRARDSLKNAEQRNPDVTEVRLVSGMINDASGRHEQAQSDLQRAVEIEPMNGDLWRQLGIIYKHSNQPNESLAAFQKAIDLQPDYFRNYKELGDFYFDRYDFAEAVRQYKRMVDAAPGQSGAHFKLARPYLNMGRYGDAESELRVSIGLRETSDAVHTLAVSLMYRDRDREAIPYYLRALELGPPPIDKYLLYLNLGTSFRRSKQPEQAERAYRSALELAYSGLEKNPTDGYIRSCVAYLLARLGDRQGGEANAVQALGLTPGDVGVPWMVALTYEALGERERTLALIRDGPDWLLSRLNRFPDLADLQNDSRFQQMIASRHIQ